MIKASFTNVTISYRPNALHSIDYISYTLLYIINFNKLL